MYLAPTGNRYISEQNQYTLCPLGSYVPSTQRRLPDSALTRARLALVRSIRTCLCEHFQQIWKSFLRFKKVFHIAQWGQKKKSPFSVHSSDQAVSHQCSLFLHSLWFAFLKCGCGRTSGRREASGRREGE